MIKVAIADDHAMFVDGIDSILKDESNISVAGKCFDGASVLDFVKSQPVDILLLDINLPDINGIEVCKQLSQSNSDLKIIAISMFNEESVVTEMLNNGAKGYILKNTGRDELIKAIETVHNGQTYFSKDVTQTIMNSLLKQRKKTDKSNKFLPKISRREKEILKLIIEEYTTPEIAEKLFISLKTVETHRSSLLAKLNARNSAGLVRIAIENKILD
ncbi:MAG TPA: response regulator transcription factor [Saprospiraceae bacterium]|nr:response regulator transcription factor [Saprospiraceae bacterium]